MPYGHRTPDPEVRWAPFTPVLQPPSTSYVVDTHACWDWSPRMIIALLFRLSSDGKFAMRRSQLGTLDGKQAQRVIHRDSHRCSARRAIWLKSACGMIAEPIAAAKEPGIAVWPPPLAPRSEN